MPSTPDRRVEELHRVDTWIWSGFSAAAARRAAVGDQRGLISLGGVPVLVRGGRRRHDRWTDHDRNRTHQELGHQELGRLLQLCCNGSKSRSAGCAESGLD